MFYKTHRKSLRHSCLNFAISSQSTKIISRILVFIFTSILQGCFATPLVLEKAKGIKDFFPNDIVAFYFDKEKQEFVLCADRGSESEKYNSQKHLISRIMKVSVTKEINKGENYNKFYSISADLDGNFSEKECNFIQNLPENSLILSAPKDLTVMEAMTLKGKIINEAIEKNEYFLVSIPDYQRAKIEPFEKYQPETPCHYDSKICIILIITDKFFVYNRNKKSFYAISISLREFKKQEEAQALWYLMLPFSITFDLFVIGLLLIGSYHPG